MLVTRQFEPQENHWSTNKLETIFHPKSPTNPRMSSFGTPLSTQSDWQGQYSFLPTGTDTYSQSYGASEGTNKNATGISNSRLNAQPRATEFDATNLEANKTQNYESQSIHRNDYFSRRKQPSPVLDIQQGSEPQTQEATYSEKQEPNTPEGVTSQEEPIITLAPSIITPLQGSPVPLSLEDNGHAKGDDEDGIVEDEDMAEGEDEGTMRPQTAAERTAQRRKMKRFRLTHQQTRFLMSEFAKQPHPDAAHRERLSREIPGLSPRQVQVWFQNRRAKIKRLTADDRERMMKMRAVPDDFDNVQALHSPYGAVHTIGTPISSPVDFGTPAYTDPNMMRPLMVDVSRRPGGDEHISPTAGLSSGFGDIGFTPSAPMSNSDLLSPLTPTANDKYGYSNHLATPLNTGPRTSNPFSQQGNTGMELQNRSQMRSLQPLQLRDTMNRSRSESLQSPLRTSMSWKGNSIDYSYSGGSASPQVSSRHSSGRYGTENMGASSGGTGFDSNHYNNNSVQSPPPSMRNYSMQSTPLHPPPQNRSRLRASSATLPLGLDLRSQYSRPVSSLESVQQGISTTPRASTAQFSTSTYTSSFPSAPLTAPIDFSMPRTPGVSTTQDYSMPQMSAPIAPSSDFSQAFRSLGGGAPGSSNPRTPMRDTFGGIFRTSHPPTSAPADVRADDAYSTNSLGPVGAGMKRKQSFTMPQGLPTVTSAPQTYGGVASMTG